jgi:hypothetical protein
MKEYKGSKVSRLVTKSLRPRPEMGVQIRPYSSKFSMFVLDTVQETAPSYSFQRRGWVCDLRNKDHHHTHTQ